MRCLRRHATPPPTARTLLEAYATRAMILAAEGLWAVREAIVATGEAVERGGEHVGDAGHALLDWWARRCCDHNAQRLDDDGRWTCEICGARSTGDTSLRATVRGDESSPGSRAVVRVGEPPPTPRVGLPEVRKRGSGGADAGASG